MAIAAIIEIPKTRSGAADPRAGSFVTVLPPEIRNRIYEYLFKSDTPVLLNDDQVRLDPSARNYVTHPTHGGDEQQDSDEDFRHGFDGFHGYVGLLLSCRQVYHESVSILYGQNTFFFSRFLDQQMHFTCTWLSNIGSNYQLLSHVHIDTYALVPRRVREDDLLPLLKLIWNYPQAKCEFTFVISGSSSSRGRNHDTELHEPVTSADVLNGVLFSLGATDALNLRQYAKYSGLMSAITVWYTGKGYVGYVRYTDVDNPHPPRVFDILDRGFKVQWAETEQANLLSLPQIPLSIINKYANASDTGVVFDLDIEKARGYRVGLSGVNDFLRYEVDPIANRVYDEVVIRMSIQEATTDFHSFKPLQKLFRVNRFESLVDPIDCIEQGCFIRMELTFRLSMPTSTTDLRINIDELLDGLKCRIGDLIITVQEMDGGMRGTRPIVWDHLQCAVFLLLSDILEHYPSQAMRPLPQIWINGHGAVLCAEYPATATSKEKIIPYAPTADDPALIQAQGYRKIKRLVLGHTLKDLAGIDQEDFSDTSILVGLWYYLRFYLWMNWREVILSIEL
ncbi:hypothetical protein J4E86_005025 [Alternaria arbusti]|uniref:uncharacterized protein n=1 Tax=Alternaria arbusti TaxID=232088 RepID=UPI00222098EF|nr:uncharacterized protein J4E86_005025 [Alternaria arbusti]KAI4957885.1 hypothetical protein J4E86_005025 [Alternaria arbusti]